MVKKQSSRDSRSTAEHHTTRCRLEILSCSNALVGRFPVLVWLWIPCSISLRQEFFGRSATSLPTNLVFRIRHSGLTASGHHSPHCFASPMSVQSTRSPF